MLKVISILSLMLFSVVGFAHEGHGSGVGHDLHHMLWMLAAVVTPLVLFGLYRLKDKE